MDSVKEYVLRLDQAGMKDVHRVGGKNASLGEMITELSEVGVRVPVGFATTAEAYREFLSFGGLADRINARLNVLDVDFQARKQSRKLGHLTGPVFRDNGDLFH